MCGILSAVNLQGLFQTREPFFNALQSLSHRGPDADGTATYLKGLENTHSTNPFNVFLGHRRLAIIDLDSRSNQPMSDGNTHIIFNGEIFNYLELREELLSRGLEFKSNSDTEVILKGYRLYGTPFFSKLNGMWSFIIYDAAQNSLVISKDRFGIKPLFYFSDGSLFYFASEIKALKRLVANLTPNIQILGHFISRGLVDFNNDTFYNEIKRFPARETWKLHLGRGQIQTEQYWDFSGKTDESIDEHSCAEKFRYLFLDSLKLRLRTDVPFGTLLSGGLDSSAISVLIHDHLNPKIRTFSVVSDSDKYSEHNYINLLVKKKGLLNNSFDFDVDGALNQVESVLDTQDEPFGSFSIVAQNMLFKRIKAETDITVLLSGQGADEILMGYLKYFFLNLSERFKNIDLLGASKLLLGALWQNTVLHQFSLAQAKRYLPGGSVLQSYIRFSGQNSKYRFNNLRERQLLDINHFSIPALTRYEDRNSMHHSLEVRLPFLDYRLVDFVVNLPCDLKIRGGWTKFLLREAVHELPNEIRWRKDKLGFTTPESDWWRGTLGEEFLNTYKRSKLEEMGIISKDSFIKEFQLYRTGKGFLSASEIFRVFIAEKWLSKM